MARTARRLLWLSLFGIVHAYFVWEGDILLPYAICGALLYPLRRFSPKILIPVGLMGYFVIPAAAMICGIAIDWVRATAAAAEQAGDQATALQQTMQDIWHEMDSEFEPTSEQLAQEQEIFQRGYWGLFVYRAKYAAAMQLGSLLVFNWGLLGAMLCGMSLMKLQVFSGTRSLRFYLLLAVVGYGIGLPVVALGIYDAGTHGYDIVRQMQVDFQLEYIGSLFVTLGHVGLLLSVYKVGAFRTLTRLLAAAGRMSLTNYLLQSILCGAIFYGWGLGQFGKLDRVEVLSVVFGIWTFQLISSTIWLRYFTFGPAEWLWRSLTYWQWHPARRTEFIPFQPKA